MSFIKGLLGFIGRTFIGLGLTFFIFSFFLSYSLADLDVFKNSLGESLIQSIQEVEGYEQSKEYCNINPSDENCAVINNPEKILENSGFYDSINKLQSYADYINILRYCSVLLFLLGFGFIYLANKKIILTIYKVCFSSTITSALAIFYYRFLPEFFNKTGSLIFENNIDVAVLNNILNIINNWLYLPIQKTYNLAILITAVFLVLTVTLFFVKRKLLNNEKKDSKNYEKRSRDSGRTEKEI